MSEHELVVAKLVVVDPNGNYLLMYRSDHPEFGIDPDLPGGTQEEGEPEIDTAIREAEEEAGLSLDKTQLKEVFSTTDYSEHGTKYVLFTVQLDYHPEIEMSWEHSGYEWIPKSEFIKKSSDASDTYMHMVAKAASDNLC